MKIKVDGITSLKFKIPVELSLGAGQKLLLNLSPLPFDFHDRISRELPDPRPPKIGFAKDRRGRWIQGADGRAMVEYNETDLVYLKKVSECTERQTTAMIFEALRGEEDIEFENQREDFESAEKFYDAIAKEMLEIGMSVGQRAKLFAALNSDNDLNLQIEDAKKNS